MRRFEWSVRALAQPAGIQRALFPEFVCHADELALEFDETRKLVVDEDELDALVPAAHAIERLDALLESMSGSERAELWTEEALSSSSEWSSVRRAAREVLQAMSWPDTPPPKDRDALYGGADA